MIRFHRSDTMIIALLSVIVSLLSGCGGGGGGGVGGDGGQIPPPPRQIEVLAIVPNPSSLVVNDNNLYFSDTSEAPVIKISLTTGNATLLAEKVGTITGLTIRGSSVYWADDRPFSRVLKRTALNGTGTTILHSGGSGTTSVFLDATSDMVIDDRNVYWVIRDNYSMLYSLVKVPLDGTPPVTITSTSTTITALAVDAGYIYWEEWNGFDSG